MRKSRAEPGVPRDDVVDDADADVPAAVGQPLADLVRRGRLRRLDLQALGREQPEVLGPHDRCGRNEEDLANDVMWA